MSAVADSNPTASRRALIAERQRRSLTWRVIHLLGSLKLALLLLATIAIACAIATFTESSFDSKIARAYIYKAPWFLVWLGVLCVNLFAVTLTRWPWQRKHLGFIVTHYGIIALLAGAVIGSRFGFEGNVVLHTDSPPLDRITTSRTALQIQNPTTGEVTLRSFDAELARPSDRHPVTIAIPGSSLQIVADDRSENLAPSERIAPSQAPDAGPGVALEFSTAMMGQHLRMALAMKDGKPAERDFFGRARIAFFPQLPTHVSAAIHETQMVFAKYAPVVQADSGSTGVTVQLSDDGETLTLAAPNAAARDFRRAESVGKKLRIGDATVEIGDYWPDFHLVNGQPATASALPNNPAVLARVTAPPAPDAHAKPLLELAPDGGGGLRYQISRNGQVTASGAVKTDGTFPLGWADWQAHVAQFLPHATLDASLEPSTANMPGATGFRAKLRAPDGREGPAQWIVAGEPSTLTLGAEAVRIAYGLEVRRVPFTISLKNFEVPRLEGTETPANFIATVEFRDLRTGATKQGVAQMNHPASWPGGFFAQATGLNYKFSQAEWNPNDLGQTTLQVLYDPGWLLKWTGSLAICAGIFIMFYLRPKKK
jgi:hypothetical protein